MNISDLYKKLCSVEGCETPVQARGYCPKHYQRWYRHGDPVKPAPPKIPTPSGPVRYGWMMEEYLRGKPCKVEGCNTPRAARGFCKVHYNEWSHANKGAAK